MGLASSERSACLQIAGASVGPQLSPAGPAQGHHARQGEYENGGPCLLAANDPPTASGRKIGSSWLKLAELVMCTQGARKRALEQAAEEEHSRSASSQTCLQETQRGGHRCAQTW